MRMPGHAGWPAVARPGGGAVPSAAGARQLREAGRRVRWPERAAPSSGNAQDSRCVRQGLTGTLAQPVWSWGWRRMGERSTAAAPGRAVQAIGRTARGRVGTAGRKALAGPAGAGRGTGRAWLLVPWLAEATSCIAGGAVSAGARRGAGTPGAGGGRGRRPCHDLLRRPRRPNRSPRNPARSESAHWNPLLQHLPDRGPGPCPAACSSPKCGRWPRPTGLVRTAGGARFFLRGWMRPAICPAPFLPARVGRRRGCGWRAEMRRPQHRWSWSGLSIGGSGAAGREIPAPGNSGFFREEPIGWCEALGADRLLRLGRKARPGRPMEAEAVQARWRQRRIARPASVRGGILQEIGTESSSRRREAVKAAWRRRRENPPFTGTAREARDRPVRPLQREIVGERAPDQEAVQPLSGAGERGADAGPPRAAESRRVRCRQWQLSLN